MHTEICTHIIIHVFHSHILLRACCNVRRPTYYGYLTCKLDNRVLLRPRRVFSIELWLTRISNTLHLFHVQKRIRLPPVLDWHHLFWYHMGTCNEDSTFYIIPIGYRFLRVILFLIQFGTLYHPEMFIPRWIYPRTNMVFGWHWPK